MIAKDLPGWKGVRKVHQFKSITEAMRLVRAGKVASTAGDCGAVDAYRDRAGNYRGHLCKWGIVTAEIKAESISELRDFLVRQLPEIGDKERLAIAHL